jgi:hypothetical protein
MRMMRSTDPHERHFAQHAKKSSGNVDGIDGGIA